jgi:hypothetical protein
VDSHSCVPFYFFPSVPVDNFALYQHWFAPLLSVSTNDQSPVQHTDRFHAFFLVSWTLECGTDRLSRKAEKSEGLEYNMCIKLNMRYNL